MSNLRSTAKAMPAYVSQKNIDLVTKRGIYTETEFRARYEIHLETYNKLINIEALTMADMIMHQILPASIKYSSDLAYSINQKRQALGSGVKAVVESALAEQISVCCDRLYQNTEKLNDALTAVPKTNLDASNYYCDVIVPAMEQLRKDADQLEKLTPKTYWPYPIYSDMLFY